MSEYDDWAIRLGFGWIRPPKKEPYMVHPKLSGKYYLSDLAFWYSNDQLLNELKDVRFNSYWGDGSPSYVDEKIKALDPTYDNMKEIDLRDNQEWGIAPTPAQKVGDE